jgi:signal transduction histidine kinase
MRLRLWPRGLVGQLLLAVAVTLFIAQAINLGLLARGQRQQQLAHIGGMTAARIIDALEREGRGVSASPMERSRSKRYRHRGRVIVSDRPFAFPIAARPVPDLGDYVANLLADADVSATQIKAMKLPVRRNLARTNDNRQAVIVQAQIDGRYYTVRSRTNGENSRFQGFLIWQTLLLYLLLLVPLLWIGWRASRPLRALTRAAHADPAARDAEPVAEQGPSDVRELIGAFNAYRARITTMLSDKDRMLGAVGHDLRTPLASLRVRVEQVDNAQLREKMIASIEEMTAMLTDILALARSGAGTEAMQAYNPGQLLFAIGEDYRAMGKAVEGPDDLPALPMLSGRSVLVRRALRNLIDNALAYGDKAIVSVEQRDGDVRFIVRDDGPGIDPARLTELVEPFARGEASRNRTTGGAGLGLAIARDIAEAEGGKLILSNRGDAAGLEAILLLHVTGQQ